MKYLISIGSVDRSPRNISSLIRASIVVKDVGGGALLQDHSRFIKGDRLVALSRPEMDTRPGIVYKKHVYISDICPGIILLLSIFHLVL